MLKKPKFQTQVTNIESDDVKMSVQLFYFFPEFDCVAENLLETWQRGNQTFKKARLFIRMITS